MSQEQANSAASPHAAEVTTRCRKVIEELADLRASVQALVPGDTAISFFYDGRLHINIDLRDLRDVERAESFLPNVADGIFSNIRRSMADHHSFRHRLTAEVTK